MCSLQGWIFRDNHWRAKAIRNSLHPWGSLNDKKLCSTCMAPFHMFGWSSSSSPTKESESFSILFSEIRWLYNLTQRLYDLANTLAFLTLIQCSIGDQFILPFHSCLRYKSYVRVNWVWSGLNIIPVHSKYVLRRVAWSDLETSMSK